MDILIWAHKKFAYINKLSHISKMACFDKYMLTLNINKYYYYYRAIMNTLSKGVIRSILDTNIKIIR